MRARCASVAPGSLGEQPVGARVGSEQEPNLNWLLVNMCMVMADGSLLLIGVI